jgi:hypothetical protein
MGTIQKEKPRARVYGLKAKTSRISTSAQIPAENYLDDQPNTKLVFSQKAGIAYNSLSEIEKIEINKMLNEYTKRPSYVARRHGHMTSIQGVLMLKVTPDIRLAIGKINNQVNVIDILNYERIKKAFTK